MTSVMAWGQTSSDGIGLSNRIQLNLDIKEPYIIECAALLLCELNYWLILYQ